MSRVVGHYDFLPVPVRRDALAVKRDLVWMTNMPKRWLSVFNSPHLVVLRLGAVGDSVAYSRASHLLVHVAYDASAPNMHHAVREWAHEQSHRPSDDRFLELVEGHLAALAVGR